MPHARRRLIDEVIAQVMNLPTTGTNVYEDPAAAVTDTALPGLVVEVTDEEVSTLGDYTMGEQDGHRQLRRLNVQITCVAKSVTQRDQSSLEVEESLMGSSIADMRRLLRSQFDSSADGNFQLWTASITFEFSYATQSTYPRVAIR